MCFSCRRIPLDSIPENESECAMWLHKLYQEKVRGGTHLYLIETVLWNYNFEMQVSHACFFADSVAFIAPLPFRWIL